jgi:GGDEF domain-containing protein
MTHLSLRPLLPWVWPGGLVLAASAFIAAAGPRLDAVDAGLRAYGWMPFVGAALLAWRFRRSRVVALLGGLSLLWLVPAGGDTGIRWDAGTAVLLALVPLVALVRDRSVFSLLGGVQLVSVALPVWVALHGERLLGPVEAGPLGNLLVWLEPGAPAALGVPWALLAPAVAALGVSIFQSLRLQHPAERAVAWCAAFVILAAFSAPGSTEALLHLSAAGLILMIGTVETSYALAFRDELTGLPTRRALRQLFDDLGAHYTIAMVDVDHFKKFNDRHGHDVGDQVLKMVAAQLEKVTGGGRSFRYGGEEFTVVFPGKNRADSLDHLETLRQRIEASSFSVRRPGRPRKVPEGEKGKGRGSAKKPAPKKLSVTVSIGVAERTEKTPDPDSVVKAADKALYRAKRAGRNRVAT